MLFEPTMYVCMNEWHLYIYAHISANGYNGLQIIRMSQLNQHALHYRIAAGYHLQIIPFFDFDSERQFFSCCNKNSTLSGIIRTQKYTS